MIEETMHGLFRKATTKALQTKVRGDVTVKIISNTMYIDIKPNSSLAFRYTLEDVTEQLYQGLTSETVADNCIKSYTRYINSQFFKQKSVDKH